MRIRNCLNLMRVMVQFTPGLAATTAGAEFPFEFHDGLIWLQVEVRESPQPLNFLLDSGADVSVVNLTTARKLGLNRGHRVRVQGVHETTTGFWPAHLAGAVNSIPLPKNLLCVDLNALSSVCECKVDGLLGADFFREHTVQIDFAARKIRLVPPHAGSSADNSLPVRMQHGAFLVPIQINGRCDQWVRLDTGCATALHWVTAEPTSEKSGSQMAVALTKIAVPMIRTTVQLGSAKFEAVPTGVHETKIFDGEAGLLGNGLLSKFQVVTLDAHSSRLILGAAQDASKP